MVEEKEEADFRNVRKEGLVPHQVNVVKRKLEIQE